MCVCVCVCVWYVDVFEMRISMAFYYFYVGKYKSWNLKWMWAVVVTKWSRPGVAGTERHWEGKSGAVARTT